MSISPRCGDTRLERQICFKYYIVLKQKSRFTFGLKAAKITEYTEGYQQKLRQQVPQKLITLKNGKSRTSSWRHSLYTSIPSFDNKDLRVCSCSVFKEQLFLRGLSNYGGDFSQGRVRAVLRDSVSTQTRKNHVNHVETLHAIQTMYGEEALQGIPLLLFLARHHRWNLTNHAKTIVC